MSENYTYNTYPYTHAQIAKFGRELNKAGGFDELMLEKKALVLKEDTRQIATEPNIEEYKQKYLIGAYAKLRPIYNTEVPYSFWCGLYLVMKRTSNLPL